VKPPLTFVQRRDGSLIDLKKLAEGDAEDIAIPAGETVLYFVEPQLGYLLRDGCEGVVIHENPTKEQAQEFVAKCYDWLGGFVMLSDVQNFRINLPIP